MTLNACPYRVHGLGICSYCILSCLLSFFFSDTIGKYVEPLLPIVPVIHLFPFLSKSIFIAYSVTIKMDAGDIPFCRCSVSRGRWLWRLHWRQRFLFLVPMCCSGRAPAAHTAPTVPDPATHVISPLLASNSSQRPKSTWTSPCGKLSLECSLPAQHLLLGSFTTPVNFTFHWAMAHPLYKIRISEEGCKGWWLQKRG